MRHMRRYGLPGLVLLALLIGGAWRLASGGSGVPADAEDVGRAPRIRPDYSGTVIPPNIAPLNFLVAEEGDRYCVRVSAGDGPDIVISSRSPGIVIPLDPWRRMLDANRGRQLRFDVYVRETDGRWRRFDTVRNTVADEEIDPYLVYRWANPMYRMWGGMEIRQRDLRGYGVVTVLDSHDFGTGCMHCHTFRRNGTDRMLIHVRSGLADYGMGMVLIEDGALTKVDTRSESEPRPAAFASWHPSGRLIAFSVNKVRQFFHSARSEPRDAFDLDSDLAVYSLDSHGVTSTSRIARRDRLETWPEWAPDGRWLYFCSAPVLWGESAAGPDLRRYREVRYDLMRVAFNVEDNTWGEPETVLSADETGLSITEPRVSPDGRFLVFCMCGYSTFPSFQPDADLYLMDLGTGRYRRMPCSTDQAESWHCWSSDSRWLVFSTKAGDGRFLKPYFSYVDEGGMARKPFVLPQKDPAFYDSFIKLYQMPELVREPVPLSAGQIARAIRTQPWVHVGMPVTGPTPRLGPGGESAPEVSPDPWSAPAG